MASLTRQSSEETIQQASAMSLGLAAPPVPQAVDFNRMASDDEAMAQVLKASEEEHKQARAQADAQAQSEAPDGSTIVDTVEVPPHIDLAKLKFVHSDQESRTGFWWLVRKLGGNKRCKLRLVMADAEGPTRFVIRTKKAHLMDVAKLVVSETLNDPAGFQLELAQRADEMVHIFVDNSNIFGGGQEVPDTTQPSGYRLDRSVRVLCRKLHDVVTLERTAVQKVVFGSVSQGTMARLTGGSVFKSWEKEGYKSCVCARNDENKEGYAGGSKGSIVDDALIAQMYTTIMTYKSEDGWNGRTLVMCTGDGNPNHGDKHSPSFLKVVQHAIECGWRVEVWAWKKTCSPNYLTLARDHAGDPCYSLMYLDEDREEITETKRWKTKHTANGSNTTTKTRGVGTLSRSRPAAGGGPRQRGAAAEEDGHEQDNSTDAPQYGLQTDAQGRSRLQMATPEHGAKKRPSQTAQKKRKGAPKMRVSLKAAAAERAEQSSAAKRKRNAMLAAGVPLSTFGGGDFDEDRKRKKARR